jgi:transcriptional regulator with XRE-family HTH domain
MSDNEIIEFIAKNTEKNRLSKNITQKEVSKKGGCNKQTLSNFAAQSTDIRLSTLIQIFRGIGELDKLQKAFEHKEQFSPVKTQSTLTERLRAFSSKEDKKRNIIKWGDN